MCLVDECGRLTPVGHLLAVNSKTIALAGKEATEILRTANYTGNPPLHLLYPETDIERVFHAQCSTTSGGIAPTIILTDGWRLVNSVGGSKTTELVNDTAAVKINLHINHSFTTLEREASWLARSSHGLWLTGSPADESAFVRVMSHMAMNDKEEDC